MMMEDYAERRELALARVLEIANDDTETKELPPDEAAYFREVAAYLLTLDEVLCRDENGRSAVSFQEPLFDLLSEENYRESFLNPTYAASTLGDNAAVFSALYADIVSLPRYAFEGRRDIVLLFTELFLEIFCNRDEAALSFAEFYHDYSEIFASETLSKLDPDDETSAFYYRLLTDADFSDISYLYEYGAYIGENEKKTAAYLAEVSEDEIQAMADTLTEGYRIGFEVTRRDLTKKKVVEIEYPIGFERMMRAVVRNFEKLNLKVAFSREAVLSAHGRGSVPRGVYGTQKNRQFCFDHRNDRGLYFDKRYVQRRLEVLEEAYEKKKDLARLYAGPAVIEVFGEPDFSPVTKPEAVSFTEKQDALQVSFQAKAGVLREKYIPGDEYSYAIISYPLPTIACGVDGEDERYRAIFRETVKINTLDYRLYRDMQQKIIDVLDRGIAVHVKGKGENKTDITVQLHTLSNPSRETIFENCVADVNIPVGEVFTSPVLEGTNGVLHVSRVYLGNYLYQDLTITFKDGVTTDYTCNNFEDEAENKKLIYDNILFRHPFLPIGEFAIGTNTTAFMMARKFGIEAKLPILIAEKTGPHFAVGDTCYSHAEDMPMYNPDGKEVVARSNSFADKRNDNPEEAYFNCHTDITIPYDELAEIAVLTADGARLPVLLDGRFVVDGTEALNEPLDK